MLALAGRHRGHAQQPGEAVGARGERGDVGTGGGDVDPLGGEAVVRDQSPYGPVAGGDDGGHRPQHLAFLGVEFEGEPGFEAGLVAEREVDEDGDAEPLRLRDDDLRDPAGDQAVDEDDGAVGQVAQGAGQFGAGGRSRAGPAAGHRVPLDLPAEAGQVQADPPVVGVAAARCGRVVHAARHHEVHGAQGHRDDLGLLEGGVLHGHVVQRGRPPGGQVGHRARS